MDITAEVLEKAKKTAEEMRSKKDFKLPETFDLLGVQVFGVGKWNGDEYTEKDLDDMIQAFDETKQFMKPYLKLGHSDNQKLIQSDGLPAAGWVEGLYKKAGKLYADFKHVPRKIYDLISAGAYRKVSAEIFWNYDLEGKTYRRMLKAVAMLGSDWPGVSTIDDMIDLFALSGGARTYEGSAKAKVYTLNIKEEAHMDELQKQLAEANKKIAEAQVEINGLKQFKDKSEGLEKEVSTLKSSLEDATRKVGDLEKKNAEYSEKSRKSEVEAILDKAVSEKKLTPAQKPMLFTLMMNASTEKRYKVGDKEQSADEILKAFIDSNSVSINDGEKSGAGDKQDLHQKIQAYMEKNKVSYREAALAVSPSNPKDASDEE